MAPLLADTNIWLALAVRNHPHEVAVQAWFNTIDQGGSLHFCRSTQQSFLRLVTTAAVIAPYGRPPLTNEDAWETYQSFFGDDRIAYRQGEPEGLERHWRNYAVRQTASPRLWMDAYLAAFARAGGYTLVTTDAAFRQFEELDLLLLGDSQAG